MNELLPSWRPGSSRDAIVGFLEASDAISPEARVAVFDNDGTLWCEKPAYAQLAFFLAELATAAKSNPALADQPEYAALIKDPRLAVTELGLLQVAHALAQLVAGIEPEDFAARAHRFLTEAIHPTLDIPYSRAVYQPMLELLDALRARDFAIFITTGGGTEFVRAVSQELYGVAPEGVVGSLIAYEYVERDGGPVLLRTDALHGEANEGRAKVVSIQQQLGRRPVFAAGNSAGDREMIEWAVATKGPTLGVLIDHDDDEREAAYESVAGTFESDERIVDVARRAGWTVVSMRHDWEVVFAP
jgi:phosphoserine phosphatase